jgi:hypothetical protein
VKPRFQILGSNDMTPAPPMACGYTTRWRGVNIEDAIRISGQDVDASSHRWHTGQHQADFGLDGVSSLAQTFDQIVTNHVMEISRMSDIMEQAIVFEFVQQATQGVVKTARVGPTAMIVSRLVGAEARLGREPRAAGGLCGSISETID